MQSLLSKLLFSLLPSMAPAYLLPNPPGGRNVTLKTGPLTDHCRNRTLMLSAFQPAKCTSTVPVPYMPDQTAEFQGSFLQQIFNVSFDVTPLFLGAQLPVCPHRTDSVKCEPAVGGGDLPVLLFSPSYSIPRLYYSSLASAVASQGFTVLTIDHPGDADIITYPDSSVVINNDTVQSLDNMRERLPDRVADVSFVIDQLSNATAMAPFFPPLEHQRLQVDKVGLFGHSVGGVTAVLAAAQDSRVRAAINWDGTFITQPSSAVSQPVLLVSHGMADASWPATWPLLEGPKAWVDTKNTTHQTFTDIPTLVQTAGQDMKALGALLGTIEPEEMVRVLVAHTSAWMKGALVGDGTPLLPDAEFAEAAIVKEVGV